MPMTQRTPDLELERERIIGDLRDLVAALDRRVPGIGREAERQIAHDAATLKRKALAQLEILLDAPVVEER